VDDDTMWGNIFRINSKPEDNIYTVLSKIPIFSDLKKKELKAVERILHQRSYKTEEIVFSKSILEGHYGNPITFFEARIEDKETIKLLVEKLSANLSCLDKDELGREINRCVERGSLYIRLDKQAAFLGKIKLVKSDPIRLRIRLRKSRTEDVIDICREIGMLT